MLQRSLTLLCLMLLAWGLVLWAQTTAQAETGVVLGPVDTLIMTNPPEQVPTVGRILLGNTVISRVWTSPTISTGGIVSYNDNGTYSFHDIIGTGGLGKGGGGLFVYGEMSFDAAPDGRLKPNYQRAKWIGMQAGEHGVSIRQQAWGGAVLGPLDFTFSTGDGTLEPLRNMTVLVLTKDIISIRAPLCWENGFCLNATSSQTLALLVDGRVVQEWRR